MRKIIFYIGPLVIIIVFLAIFFSAQSVKYADIKGEVVNELCKEAVWGVRIVVDGKCITRYLSKTYYLTEIEPGSHTLVVTAPNYNEFKEDIQVNKGVNIVNISMKGKEIPDLNKIRIFTKTADEGLQLEIVFFNSQRKIIEHYPCLPLSLEGKLFLDIGKKESEKGRKIFEGPIELFWDPKASLGKNKATISWDKIDIDIDKEEWEKKKVIILKDYGILDAILHTPQGNFEYTASRVRLFQLPDTP